MSWDIRDRYDVVKATVDKVEYNDKWMEECYVTATIESPYPVNFKIGDYIIYRDERFEINYDPGKIKSAPCFEKGDAFRYENVKFNSLADELTRCDFLDVVLNDNQFHFTGLPKFSFYGNVMNLADRIQANLDRAYGKDVWHVEVDTDYISTEERNVSVDNIKVQGALSILVNDFKTYYNVKGRTITIGAAGVPADHLFKYGKGNGLYEIEQNAETDQQIVTRLRAYGSTRNIPHRYYNGLSGADGKKLIPDNMAVQYLMLPDFPYVTQDPYIDSKNIAALGVREGTIFFDGSGDLEEIYPSIEGMTAEQLKEAGVQCNATGALDELVSAEQMTDNGVGKIEGDAFEGNATTTADPPTFKITIKDVGFDINEHIIDGNSESPTISFKSGMLGGRDFVIKKCTQLKSGLTTTGYELVLDRIYDDGIKLWFPYKDYNAKEGDKFVLLNIRMPEVYIKAAAQRLLKAAKEWLSKNDYSRSVFAPKIDEIFMARQHDAAMASKGKIKSLHDTLRAGMQMLFEDDDLGIDAAIFIDSLTITEGDSLVPTYDVVLKEEKTVGTLEKMQNQIDSLSAGQGQGQGGYNAAQIRNLINAYGGQYFLSKIKADRTPYALAVGGKLTAEAGLHAGNFVAGFSGAAIDEHGNAEVESIIVRSYMKVFELIYNRLNALEGNTSFADSGTIEAILSSDGDTCTALMRKRWDGDFTAFQEGDIVYGYVNDLRKENGGTNIDYYKAWAYVTAVDRDANTLTLVRYADADVPAGKNFDMRANMLISRWGNITDKSRQSSFYISCEDGNLVELMGVDSPILREGNYGTILGRLPDGFAAQLGIDALINPDQPYLYARGIVVQDLIRVNYQGLKIRTPQWRGEWDAATATSDTEYYRITDDTEDWVTLDGTLYRYISEEQSTLRPDEDPQHWVALTGKLSAMWEIVPSVNTIHIAADGYSTDLVECTIRCNSMAGVEDITTPERLDTFGLELVFSLDGISYNEFWVRNGAEIEGTGLLVGGNNVPWIEVLDNIMLDLREKATGKTLHRKYIPVTRDGESIPGADGKDGGYTETRYLVNDGYDALPESKLPDRDADVPAGWTIDHGAVIYGEQSLWQITARKDADGHLVQGARWTEPVMLTGIPGKNGVSKPGPIAYPAGIYDPMVTYISDASKDPVKCPVVLDNGQYYMLLPGKEYRGEKAQYASPSVDYANNPDTVWEMMTRFSSVFADILMANFGKIGSAVFWNNLLISQYGKDAAGNDTNQYQNFDNTTRFTPNLLIDFLYGLLRCNNVDITGRVNATSGQIGNLLISGNRLVGLDSNGTEVVSIGVGELTDIGAAFSERALALTMLSMGVSGSMGGYSDSVLTVNGGRNINLGVTKDAEHRLSPSYDDTHLYCTFGFSVEGDASTVTFDGMSAYATTTFGNPFAQILGTASLYHDQDEGRTNRIAQWSIGQMHSVGGLAEGGYIVDIAITVDGLQGDWTGHIEFETGFVKTLVASNQAQRVEVASDGLLCYQGNDRYFMFSRRSGMEVRFGSYGLQLGVNGLKKLVNNTWKDI